jgi:hypothetical protein
VLIYTIFIASSSECYIPDNSTKGRFEKGSITLTDVLLLVYIENDIMIFRGTYWFKSTFSKDIIATISFPFYIDKTHPFPRSIQISNVTVLLPKSKVLKILKDSIQYLTSFKSNEKTRLIIEYKQDLKEPKAVYLFTANDLKIPLQSLRVYIYVPDKYKEVNISYKYKKTKKLKDYIMYTIDEKDIIPNKNLIIEWKKD